MTRKTSDRHVVSLMLTLNIYYTLFWCFFCRPWACTRLLWVILLVFQSILDWSFQVSSIYREDFQEVEYFHEVECTGGGWISPQFILNTTPIRGLLIWEVSTRLASSFSQEPTLDSMIETCEKCVEKQRFKDAVQ